MWERVTVVGLSLLLLLGSLALSGWLIFSGEAPGVEGLFLASTALVVALACAASLWYLVEPPPPAKPGAKSPPPEA